MNSETEGEDRGTVHVVRGARGFALAVRARSSLLSQAFWAVSQHLLCDKTEEPSPCLHEYGLSGNKALIQKKVLNTDILNAIVISPWLHIVLHHNDFLEGIGDSDQRGNLLFLLFRIIDG